LKIELTETEITHIMDALDARIEDLTDCLATVGDPEIEDEIAELTELCMDLFEAVNRPEDPFSGSPVVDAALEMVQAGIDAREEVKATSRAAERRNERMMKGTASPVSRDFSNDPIDW
jgi:hypothetical protein